MRPTLSFHAQGHRPKEGRPYRPKATQPLGSQQLRTCPTASPTRPLPHPSPSFHLRFVQTESLGHGHQL